MKTSGTIVLSYALLILVGGIMGHVKAASQMSLIVGTLSGLALLACAVMLYKNKVLGGKLALILGLCLDAFFTYRLIKTLKFFPSGMMTIISLLFLLILSLSLRKEGVKSAT